MYSSKRVQGLFVILLAIEALLCDVHEPQCFSRFDFEEKMLDKLVRNEIKIEEVVGKLDVLEKRLTNVETEVNEIHGLEKKHGAAIDNSIQGLEKTCDSLQTELETFENTTKSTFVGLEKSAEVYSERLDAIINNATGRMTQDPVAFFATLSSSFTISSSAQTIVFNSVVTDEGGAYNPGTGVFTAPTDGLYVFSATVMVYMTKPSSSFQIKKNDSRVVFLLVKDQNNNDYETVSSTALLSLHVGDTVHVTCGASGGIIYSNYTFLSGFKL